MNEKKRIEAVFRKAIEEYEKLYLEMSNYIPALDFDITINKRRSISSPHLDARFCAGRPMKEYVYIKFKVNCLKKKIRLFFSLMHQGVLINMD